MKHRKGKWLAILLVLVFTMTMLPEAAFAAETGNTSETEVRETASGTETQEDSSSEEIQSPVQSGTDSADQSDGQTGIGDSEQPDEQTGTGDSDQPDEQIDTGDTDLPDEQIDTGDADIPDEQAGTSNADQLQEQPETDNAVQLRGAAASNNTQTESSVAKVGDTYYDTLAEAFTKVGTQGTVELVADAELSTRILIAAEKDITLNLGSYTVKSDGSFFDGYSMLFENRGTLTITGEGTIDATAGVNPYIGIENKGQLRILSGSIIASWNGIRNIGGTLNISGGTVTNTSTASDGQDCAVYAEAGSTTISGNAHLNGANTALRSYGANVTVSENAYLEGQFGVMLFNSPAENTESAAHSVFSMTGGTVNARYGLALSGNNTQSALCSAEITGGTLTAVEEATAIYWPMEGTLTVGGSAVVEGGTGIEAKMGTINIIGGTITGTGAYLDDEPYQGGSQSEGSALLVASQMYGGNSGQYAQSPALTVNITGGTLSGNQGNAVTVYNTEDTESQETVVTVNGGTLSAASGRADVSVVNASDQNKTALEQEDGANSFVSSQSQTKVTVSSSVAAAAVDEAGNTAYYTDVNEALAANTESAESAIDIYILKNSEISSEALKSENIRLTTAEGVELTVESSVDGMKVSETVNEDGSKTYELVEAYDVVYVNGTSGKDTEVGEDASHAVKTLKRALELVADDGTIYVCGTVTVDSSLTVDGAKIERADGYTGSLISVSGSDTVLTLKNTLVDGKNETVAYSSYLVFVTNSGTLNIEEGTELINNKTTAVYVNNNSFLNMNGGAIKKNTTVEKFGGGGIYSVGTTVINGGEISGNSSSIWGGGILAERGSLTLNGGEIKNNSAANGAGVTINGGAQAILDGASIIDNNAVDFGAGVYVQGFSNSDGLDTVFEMRSGVISGNVSENAVGAGIFGYYYDGNTVIRISGGSIKDNAADMGSAVAILGLNGSKAYPRLELSGSPEIVGDIFCQNDYENGYVIYVTDEFSPVCPVEITRSNNIFDIPAVEYAAGLTPDRENFTSGTIFEGFVVKGQNLVWAKASIVYFYDEDKTEYKDNRHGVVLGEKIDIADAPTPTKTGYSLEGWYAENSTEPWNFEEDVVQDPSTRLYARWSLNAPTVTLSADDATPHIGSSATLTAKASHDLAGVTYTYQWYKDRKAIEGATSDKLTISEAGSYSVKVKASDGEQISAETEGTPVEVSIEDHTFGEWTQITSPTCENQGSEQRVCSVCQYTETRNVDPLGHDWETEFTVDKAPTCTEAGSQSIHCKNCDAVKDSAVMPATGHTQSAEWKTDENNHWKVCTACGETIDAAAHSFKWVVDKEATAEAAGSKHEECTVCGYAKDAVEIPATGTTGEPSEPSKPEATPTEPPKDNSETGTTAGPQTGDNSNMNLWFALAGVGVAGLGATILFQKRRKIKE